MRPIIGCVKDRMLFSDTERAHCYINSGGIKYYVKSRL
jgi:hypothetical protein